MRPPHPPTLLRPSQPADVQAITAIYAHHVREGAGSFELDPPGAEEMARRRLDVVSRGLPWLVAEQEGQVQGYAYAGVYRPRPAYRYTLEDSIYVAAEASGRGIGRLLLAELLARCEALGARQMVAVIGDSANAGSIRLHERLGFRHAGRLPSTGWKFGRWLDTVLMQRPLGHGDTTAPPATAPGGTAA